MIGSRCHFLTIPAQILTHCICVLWQTISTNIVHIACEITLAHMLTHTHAAESQRSPIDQYVYNITWRCCFACHCLLFGVIFFFFQSDVYVMVFAQAMCLSVKNTDHRNSCELADRTSEQPRINAYNTMSHTALVCIRKSASKNKKINYVNKSFTPLLQQPAPLSHLFTYILFGRFHCSTLNG